MHQLWDVILWTLNALIAGKFPLRNWNGQPWPSESSEAALADSLLADGFFMVPWQWRSDMEYLSNYLHLEHHGAWRMCPWCRARRDPRDTPWKDFKADADWVSTCWSSVAEWRAYHSYQHPLFFLPGFSIFCVMVDVLHVVDLGVNKHLLGNILFHLVISRKFYPEGTRARFPFPALFVTAALPVPFSPCHCCSHSHIILNFMITSDVAKLRLKS